MCGCVCVCVWWHHSDIRGVTKAAECDVPVSYPNMNPLTAARRVNRTTFPLVGGGGVSNETYSSESTGGLLFSMTPTVGGGVLSTLQLSYSCSNPSSRNVAMTRQLPTPTREIKRESVSLHTTCPWIHNQTDGLRSLGATWGTKTLEVSCCSSGADQPVWVDSSALRHATDIPQRRRCEHGTKVLPPKRLVGCPTLGPGLGSKSQTRGLVQWSDGNMFKGQAPGAVE